MKYVIDLRDGAQMVQEIGKDEGDVYTISTGIDNLEPLNSDYINEHFGSLQDDAYNKGLEDAWSAARILLKDANVICGDSHYNVIMNMSPAEAIAKIKEYGSRKQSEQEIKVGDEVKAKWGALGVVTRTNGGWCNVAWSNGETGYYLCNNVTKTGRSYTQIAEIMETMKGGEGE